MLPVRVHVPVDSLYTSAVARARQLPTKMFVHLRPPATRTMLWSNPVIVWKTRGTFIFPVTVHVPVAGLYSSADLTEWGQKQGESGPFVCKIERGEERQQKPAPSSPPATSTLPSANRSDGGSMRLVCILPVRVHVPAAGLYNSAEAMANISGLSCSPVSPPATSTWPFISGTAVWFSRATFILPVRLHVPVAGLYSSAEVRALPPETFIPPMTSTLPFDSRAALWFSRATFMLPVRLHFPVAGS